MPTSQLEILVAEDNDADVLLLHRAFQDAEVPNPIRVVQDGQAAIDYLQGLDAINDRAPALIILDLKLPRKTGLEVLRWVRSRTELNGVPVFIFSSSGLPRDVEPAYEHGASIYIVKPSGILERAQIARFIREWLRLQKPPLAVSTGLRASQTFHSAWLRHRPPPSHDRPGAT